MFHTTEVGNFSDNFNKAASMATKEYVVFVHNDIVLAPGFIENLEKHCNPNTVVSYTTIEPPIFAGHERPGKIIKDFSADDDIIYPSDYIEKTIQAIDKHDCIITYHGRRLKGIGVEYYRGHDSYSAFKTVNNGMYLDVCGTGVTAFKTDYFNPISLLGSEHKKMSDVIFSLKAMKEKKKMFMLPHSQGWITEQRTIVNIHSEQIKNSQTQTTLCDEILNLK